MTTLLSIVLALFVAPAPTPVDAQTVVREAIEAMGGEARLRGMTTLRLEAVGDSYAIDQSEGPESPWGTDYAQRAALRDREGGRLRRSSDTRSTYVPEWTASTLIVSDGVAATISGADARPASPIQLEEAALAIALGPERVLLTARDAKDLT